MHRTQPKHAAQTGSFKTSNGSILETYFLVQSVSLGVQGSHVLAEVHTTFQDTFRKVVPLCIQSMIRGMVKPRIQSTHSRVSLPAQKGSCFLHMSCPRTGWLHDANTDV